MQIMPDTFVDQLISNRDSHSRGSLSDASFANEFASLLQNSGRSYSPSDNTSNYSPNQSSDYSSGQDYDYSSMVSAPYNLPAEPFSDYAPQETRLTASEVQDLADTMRQDGAPEEAIQAVSELADYPGGPTMGMIEQAVRDALGIENSQLNEVEQAHLANLNNKLAGENGELLTQLMNSGLSREAMDKIMGLLKGNGDAITMSREEMQALLKALNMPASSRGQIMQAFGDSSEITMSGDSWHKFLGQAQIDLNKQQADFAKAMASLEKNAASIFKDAAAREELARQTALGDARNVSNLKAMIEDTATQGAPGREDIPADGKQSHEVGRKKEQQLEGNPVADSKDIHRQSADTRNARNSRAAAEEDASRFAEAKGVREKNADTGKDKQENFAQSNKDGKSFDASTLVDSRKATSTTPRTENVLFATVAPGSESMQQAGQTKSSQQLPTLPPQAKGQIEDAIMSASKNGTRKLEVSLNPVELGAMSVVLSTSRSGEISAIIRPERAETAHLITQQVEQIRAELENQGFKVDKIDIQMQLADDRSAWQGAEHHNNSRDMSEKSQYIERLRRLNQLGGDSSMSLARDMQLERQTASVAEQGLHLVA